MKKIFLGLLFPLLFVACNSEQNTKPNTSYTQSNEETPKMSAISPMIRTSTIQALTKKYPDADQELLTRGVNSCADFWTPEDSGDSTDAFKQFCLENFVANPQEKQALCSTLNAHLEIIFGCYNKMELNLKHELHVVGPKIRPIDLSFGSLDPSAHFSDDMFNSRIAFNILLNFPHYSLTEQNTLGKTWSREDWAYARLGDLFTSRIPAKVSQNLAKVTTEANNYIDNYNIYMGQIRNSQNEPMFNADKILITHWGLRDELKTYYSNPKTGLEKQRMIYQIMNRIIDQSIPQEVINQNEVTWNPITNVIQKDGKTLESHGENDTRYQEMLNLFHANQQVDLYSPIYPTCIQRAFDRDMQISSEAIEKLFITLLSSKEVGEVAHLIEARLGRKLEPFDIWYDGFKARSFVNEDELTAKTRALYPTVESVQNALPLWLVKLGFTPGKAKFITDRVQVDPSRGAGHAWGAQMRDDKAHLRTRVSEKGMDYKGYNIATHEFGHNVEQTISLQDVDYYTMHGVPSTAFTEALAFVFQRRDLFLLGQENTNPQAQASETLDSFWGCYEIMGVALVDLYTWQWLYDHPTASVEDFKAAVIANAQKVWNAYYAPYLGEKDSKILAVYSHMICIPLYLPNYPYGHLVQYQIEQQLEGHNFGEEVERMFSIGKLTPDLWMQHCSGHNVSTQPLIKATHEATEKLKALD